MHYPKKVSRSRGSVKDSVSIGRRFEFLQWLDSFSTFTFLLPTKHGYVHKETTFLQGVLHLNGSRNVIQCII